LGAGPSAAPPVAGRVPRRRIRDRRPARAARRPPSPHRIPVPRKGRRGCRRPIRPVRQDGLQSRILPIAPASIALSTARHAPSRPGRRSTRGAGARQADTPAGRPQAGRACRRPCRSRACLSRQRPDIPISCGFPRRTSRPPGRRSRPGCRSTPSCAPAVAAPAIRDGLLPSAFRPAGRRPAGPHAPGRDRRRLDRRPSPLRPARPSGPGILPAEDRAVRADGRTLPATHMPEPGGRIGSGAFRRPSLAPGLANQRIAPCDRP
jgi:hypothetical protein